MMMLARGFVVSYLLSDANSLDHLLLYSDHFHHLEGIFINRGFFTNAKRSLLFLLIWLDKLTMSG